MVTRAPVAQWIMQQISNLWIAGSSPAGRAKNSNHQNWWLFISESDEKRQFSDFAKIKIFYNARKSLILLFFFFFYTLTRPGDFL